MIYMVSLLNDSEQRTLSIYGVEAADERGAIEEALAILNPATRYQWTEAEVYEVTITDEETTMRGTLQ